MTSTSAAATAAAVPSKVLLGLFDGYMSLKEDRLTSTTKIGGTATIFPALSDADATRIRQWTSCGVCGHPMSLLTQAYSPLPTAPTATPHHRMLYVYACNCSYCARQPSSSMVAFSVQVDQEDETALADDDDDDDVIETGPLLPSELPESVLPPCYVYIDAEPAREVVVPTDVERELIKMAEANAQSAVTEEEVRQLEQMVDLNDKRTDDLYEKFRARVARAPTQVLRYYERTVHGRNITPAAAAAMRGKEESGGTESAGRGDHDGHPPHTSTSAPIAAPSARSGKEMKPIFMNPDKVRAMVTIPPCASCGSAQTAELQVMPTALYYLHVSQYTARARAEAVAISKTSGDASTTPGRSATAAASTATVVLPTDAAPILQPSTVSAGLTTSGSAATQSATTALTMATPPTKVTGNVDDGCDFGTITVYVCSRDCAARQCGVLVRRETLCVEEPPMLQDEERARTAEVAAASSGGLQAAPRKTLRELLYDDVEGHAAIEEDSGDSEDGQA